MNISDYLFEFLKQYNRVEVTGFGVFSFENSKAEIKTDEKMILPPAKRVVFMSNQEAKGVLFLNYLAQKKGISIGNAKFEIETQVDFWQKKFNAKDDFAISRLGNYKNVEGNWIFEGSRVEKDSPDFFGLEKINYNQFDESPGVLPKKSNRERSTVDIVLLLFLIIIPVVGLLYVAYTYKDVLLGKKNTKEISIKTSTHRIEDEADNKPTIQMDSIKIDSLSIQEEIPKIVHP